MFSGDYWPNEGGIAAHLYYLTRALCDLGQDVTVVGALRPGKEPSVEARRSSRGRLTEIVLKRRGPWLIRGVLLLVAAFFVLVRLTRQRWDVIHFHNFVPDGILLGVFAWPPAKVRLMTNHSSQYLQAMERGKGRLRYRLLSRAVNGFIAPSDELRRETEPIMGPGQIVRYIPNGVDIDHFAPGPATAQAYAILGVDVGRTIVLSVRRHSEKCGLEYLVKAVPAVLRERPEAMFCLIGHGEQTLYLKALARTLGVADQVRFPGNIPHTLLPDILRAAYVTILPSLYEAVSLAGLESLACGVPVIGTRVGGIPAFVLDGVTGKLIEPRSSDAIARAIVNLMGNPELRKSMSIASRELAAKRFRWNAVAEEVLQCYGELGAISGKRGS